MGRPRHVPQSPWPWGSSGGGATRASAPRRLQSPCRRVSEERPQGTQWSRVTFPTPLVLERQNTGRRWAQGGRCHEQAVPCALRHGTQSISGMGKMWLMRGCHGQDVSRTRAEVSDEVTIVPAALSNKAGVFLSISRFPRALDSHGEILPRQKLKPSHGEGKW